MDSGVSYAILRLVENSAGRGLWVFAIVNVCNRRSRVVGRRVAGHQQPVRLILPCLPRAFTA
jgi:hypothetical protein